MKLTDHGDFDPAVEKRLEIDDAVRAKCRADELAWQMTLVLDALRTQQPLTARGVANYFCNDNHDQLVCLIAGAYRYGDWRPVIDELRELFDAAVKSVAEEMLPAEFRKDDAS